MDENLVEQHEEERFSHALYGLIIITATLAAERSHVESATDALALLAGTALVLLLVHTYTAVMAVRSVEGHALGAAGRRIVAADNIPVVAAVVVPVVAFVFAGAGSLNSSPRIESRLASRLSRSARSLPGAQERHELAEKRLERRRSRSHRPPHGLP